MLHRDRITDAAAPVIPGWPQTWAEWAAATVVASAAMNTITWGCVIWNGFRHRATQRLLRALAKAVAEIREDQPH